MQAPVMYLVYCLMISHACIRIAFLLFAAADTPDAGAQLIKQTHQLLLDLSELELEPSSEIDLDYEPFLCRMSSLSIQCVYVSQ